MLAFLDSALNRETRKKNPRVEVEIEIHRTKRAAEGWKDVWNESRESEPWLYPGRDDGRAGTAGAGFHMGQSEAKGDASAQGFISSQCSAEIWYSQNIKAQPLQL